MVKVIYDPFFKKKFKKVKDFKTKEKIIKQIFKLKNKPNLGKPMRYSRKGTREIYISPYRLSYLFLEKENILYLLDIYHKDFQ